MEIVFGLAISGLIGLLIAESRGREKAEGCALGCLLGPIGWLIEAFLPSQEEEATAAPAQSTSSASGASPRSSSTSDGRPERKCPHCAEIIFMEASVCKHCGRDVGNPDPGDEVRPCPYCDVPIRVDSDECPECMVVNPFR